MAYGQIKGRKPFERASKIAHTEILNNPDVQKFVAGCTLPSAPPGAQLDALQKPLPPSEKRITTVIAVDGGLTEVAVRKEFPSASVAFMTFGPLMLELSALQDIDLQPFIAPEDMARLKNLKRYSLVLPTKAVRAPGVGSFRAGVRKTIQSFMAEKQPALMKALQWLLFREWMPEAQRVQWTVPKCPHCEAETGGRTFQSGGPIEQSCQSCRHEIFLSDAMRLYERIDEEQGAGGILAYLITTLEQLVIVDLIRSILDMKPAMLREVLLIRDGPLAFFGVTAPLRKPMMRLMAHLADKDNGQPRICLVGLEKGGHFVEHAALVAPELKPNHYLMLDSEYVYKYVQPGDPTGNPFGFNTYYGGKLIFKSARGDVFVATIPMKKYEAAPKIEDLLNAPEILRVIAELRCAMYDSALLPVVLANRLVSLADVPSKEILQRFTKQGVVEAAS
jgi:hypothetical protein